MKNDSLLIRMKFQAIRSHFVTNLACLVVDIEHNLAHKESYKMGSFFFQIIEDLAKQRTHASDQTNNLFLRVQATPIRKQTSSTVHFILIILCFLHAPQN